MRSESLDNAFAPIHTELTLIATRGSPQRIGEEQALRSPLAPAVIPGVGSKAVSGKGHGEYVLNRDDMLEVE